jgi:long-subunit acyl-CoA synthetase (AMP-forming)
MRGSDVKGSNGPPVPSLSCKLIDPKEGREVGVREEGEVWLKGPSTFMGYVDNPKATEESITPDGWFKTGATREGSACADKRTISRNFLIQGTSEFATNWDS